MLDEGDFEKIRGVWRYNSKHESNTMTIDDGEDMSLSNMIRGVRRYRRKPKPPEKKVIELQADAFKQDIFDSIKEDPAQRKPNRRIMCWPDAGTTRRASLMSYVNKGYNYFILSPCLDLDEDCLIHVHWVLEYRGIPENFGRFEIVTEKTESKPKPKKTKFKWIADA